MCFLQYFQFVSVRTKQRTVLSHGDVGGSSCSALLLAVLAHFNIFVVDTVYMELIFLAQCQ